MDEKGRTLPTLDAPTCITITTGKERSVCNPKVRPRMIRRLWFVLFFRLLIRLHKKTGRVRTPSESPGMDEVNCSSCADMRSIIEN